MSLSQIEINKLNKIISLAEELLSLGQRADKGAAKGVARNSSKRIRRTGPELIAFRKMLKAERKKGARVEEIAQRHGVSAAYIYQLG